jgi:hypothetical protein
MNSRVGAHLLLDRRKKHYAERGLEPVGQLSNCAPQGVTLPMSQPVVLQEIAGAARALNVSEKTARGLVKQGVLKPSACVLRADKVYNFFHNEDLERAKRELAIERAQ